MTNGCNHPIGPLRWPTRSASTRCSPSPSRCTTSSATRSYAPPPLLRRMVEAGHLGRKTGRGFYVYT